MAYWEGAAILAAVWADGNEGNLSLVPGTLRITSACRVVCLVGTDSMVDVG